MGKVFIGPSYMHAMNPKPSLMVLGKYAYDGISSPST